MLARRRGDGTYPVDQSERRMAEIWLDMSQQHPSLQADLLEFRGYWQGAIQSITQSNHMVYPGTISRTVISERGRLAIFTHGIGINRFRCTTGFVGRFVAPGQLFGGLVNDYYGKKAFEALDTQLKKQFNASPLGLPQAGGSATGNEKPTIDQSFPQAIGGVE